MSTATLAATLPAAAGLPATLHAAATLAAGLPAASLPAAADFQPAARRSPSRIDPMAWRLLAVASGAASYGVALAGLMLAVHGGWTGADLLHHLLALGLGGAALLLQRLAALGSLRCLQARGWIDAATGFHNLRGLLGEGDALLRQAQRADRPLGIVLLDFADLREARQVLGAAAADRIAGRLVRRIRRISGADGLIARTGAGQFVVLLPGQGQQGSVAALQRGLGRATTLECEAEVVLVPDVLVDVATRLECSIGHVFREMVQELYAQRGQEERRVRQVQRERERHLRPAGPAQPDAAALE